MSNIPRLKLVIVIGIGYGLCWVIWFTSGVNSPPWLPLLQEQPQLAVPLRLTIYASYAVASLATVLISRKISPIKNHRPLLLLAATISGIGMGLLCFTQLGYGDYVLLFVGAVMVSTSIVVVTVMWLELMAAFGAQTAVMSMAISIIVGAAVSYVATLIGNAEPEIVSVLLMFALPFSTVLYSWITTYDKEELPHIVIKHMRFKMPKAVLLCSFVFGMVFSYTMALGRNTNDIAFHISGLAWLISTVVIASVILVAAIGRFKNNVLSLCRPMLPVLSICLLLAPVIAPFNNFLSGGILLAGYLFSRIFLTAVCADIIHRYHASAPFVYCFIVGINYLGLIGGSFLYDLLLAVLPQELQIPLITLLGTSLLIVTYYFFLREQQVYTLWGLIPKEDAVRTAEEITERCELLAADFELTPREREILLLLVQGADIKEMHVNLDISVATVRTHVNNIYGKMEIHSRADLMQKVLFGNEYQASNQSFTNA